MHFDGRYGRTSKIQPPGCDYARRIWWGRTIANLTPDTEMRALSSLLDMLVLYREQW